MPQDSPSKLKPVRRRRWVVDWLHPTPLSGLPRPLTTDEIERFADFAEAYQERLLLTYGLTERDP
jgi:hypothetical protein